MKNSILIPVYLLLCWLRNHVILAAAINFASKKCNYYCSVDLENNLSIINNSQGLALAEYAQAQKEAYLGHGLCCRGRLPKLDEPFPVVDYKRETRTVDLSSSISDHQVICDYYCSLTNTQIRLMENKSRPLDLKSFAIKAGKDYSGHSLCCDGKLPKNGEILLLINNNGDLITTQVNGIALDNPKLNEEDTTTTKTTISKTIEPITTTLNTAKTIVFPDTMPISTKLTPTTTPTQAFTTVTATTTKKIIDHTTLPTAKTVTSATSINDTQGRCGEDFGSCKPDYCCSQYGYCGQSVDHCYNGCQNQFGVCQEMNPNGKNQINTVAVDQPISSKTQPIPNLPATKTIDSVKEESTIIISLDKPLTPSETTVNPEGKCGPGIGQCQFGYCCSEYGYCGTTPLHCDQGCQPHYGLCTSPANMLNKTNINNNLNGLSNNKDNSNINGNTNQNSNPASANNNNNNDGPRIAYTIDDRCGIFYGKCLEGSCCSQFGYCGTTAQHCNVAEGCQSAYGTCK